MSTEKQSSKFMTPRITFGDQLRFSPYAWAKLLWMRDRGDTEVAGYATTATDDPFLVTDFRLVKQECTVASFELDPNDIAEDVEQTLDAGLAPWQTHNILCHSHPGNSPNPSLADETNFKKAFSHPNWAIMFIIADGGATYCRMKINVGPGVIKEIKVTIDWAAPFNGADTEKWEKEYKEKVRKLKFRMTGKEGAASKGADNFPDDDPLWFDAQEDRWCSLSQAEQDEFDRECENQDESFDELDCFWDVNGNVTYWDDDDGTYFYYNPLTKTWYSDIDGDDNKVSEVVPPHEQWVAQIVLWADKYAHERHLALEEAS